MKAGIRVIRGPDWKWGDQDGGVGQIGTVIKPGFAVSHNPVVNGSVFVRWDSGKVGNYRIGEQRDLRVYSSTCAGVEHEAFCNACKEKRNILGTRWKCSSCESFDLCDDCYHGDQHKLDHRFLKRDLSSSEGVLVHARKDSIKLEVKGVFPGAIVIRTVEDWVLGQSDDGAQGTTGTVIIYDDDGAKSLQTTAAARKQRRKAHGSVRVRWTSGNILEHRRGFDGKVDVFCCDASDTVSGGTCYADHLTVLDSTMMLGNTKDGRPFEEDSESSDDYDSSDDSRITSPFSHTGSLDELLALSGRTRLLHHTERFDRGDRVQVLVDPEQFKKMQVEQYGGWNDTMALYIGLTGTVLGVLPSGGVAVRYTNMPRNRWILNPDALSKQDYFVGDSVQIMADEAAVRRLQIGHGGWVYRMKEILGKVGEVVQLNHDSTILVKLDKMEWLLNMECCKLMDGSRSSAADKKELDSDTDDEGTTLSSLLVRTGGDLSGVLSAGAMERLLRPETLVEFAAKNDIGSVKAVLARFPTEVDIKNCNKTALHLAASHGHVEMVRCLIEHGANILEPEDDGNTPVHYAAYEDRPDALEVLLQQDDDNANAVNFRLISVLRLAVHRQALSCIEVLLRHNVDVNVQDEQGDTVLHDAIIVGSLGAVDLIAAHPAYDYFITNGNGLTVLQLAVMKNDLYAVKSIVRYAPQQLIDVQKEDGFTALHLACLNGLYDIVEVLITQGKANMELINNEHRTPLLCALSRAKVSIVELLASRGANVNAYDYQYRTALHWILMMISSGGAMTRSVDDMFNAVQMSLIYSELPEGLRDRQWVAVACCMVRYGADIYQADGVGMTPIGLVTDSAIRDALMTASKNRFSCIGLSKT